MPSDGPPVQRTSVFSRAGGLRVTTTSDTARTESKSASPQPCSVDLEDSAENRRHLSVPPEQDRTKSESPDIDRSDQTDTVTEAEETTVTATEPNDDAISTHSEDSDELVEVDATSSCSEEEVKQGSSNPSPVEPSNSTATLSHSVSVTVPTEDGKGSFTLRRTITVSPSDESSSTVDYPEDTVVVRSGPNKEGELEEGEIRSDEECDKSERTVVDVDEKKASKKKKKKSKSSEISSESGQDIQNGRESVTSSISTFSRLPLQPLLDPFVAIDSLRALLPPEGVLWKYQVGKGATLKLCPPEWCCEDQVQEWYRRGFFSSKTFFVFKMDSKTSKEHTLDTLQRWNGIYTPFSMTLGGLPAEERVEVKIRLMRSIDAQNGKIVVSRKDNLINQLDGSSEINLLQKRLRAMHLEADRLRLELQRGEGDRPDSSASVKYGPSDPEDGITSIITQRLPISSTPLLNPKILPKSEFLKETECAKSMEFLRNCFEKADHKTFNRVCTFFSRKQNIKCDICKTKAFPAPNVMFSHIISAPHQKNLWGNDSGTTQEDVEFWEWVISQCPKRN